MKYHQLAIQETIEDLKFLMSQTITHDSFKKVKALYLLKSNKVSSITKLALVLGVSRITIHRWLNRYQKGGIDRLIYHQSKKGRRQQIPPEALQELKSKLTLKESGFKTYCEVQSWLQDKYGLQVSYNVVYATIRYRLNLQI
ncbi:MULTISPECIES: helix-turn-helix domain-containing protein [Arthrospira]|uniref:Transposase n=1 Tax=Limnospira platensis NIES-46 TaxID=1236695 RepID=A0A5M3T5L0_LIMPL|nr:helix-turn-helix domain-containing protein [Arthrospira platensis]AMW28827.1 transposase [Arthrospira platensis YZ]KDR57569.1 transposase [Arthrospira platensis str. Paraca]MBD2668329.1 helix-turn-helix domain-containing protein [Arthrospira platensis FACHB-439]MBD2709523.1 helix-turn-helix domain-containing protein [Arthrospira platensis FACHB-835]MDF2210294.1 helix-turn-helix domain-containing protein [Arthrospira platensis NCB002]MDT9294004.1 helix-turn-helix domain-containing protein [